MSELKRIKGLLLDMDGVIYRGDTLIAGANEFFRFLRTARLPYVIITNNAQRTIADQVSRLRRLGIQTDLDKVLTSGEAVARHMAQYARRGARIYAIGQAGLLEPLRAAGFVLTDQQPEYVVVGMDTGFDYDKLSKACLAIRAGAAFIAANPDVTLPVENGLVLPGNGALIAAIQACSGQQPRIIGKPEPTMLQVALDSMGLTANDAAIVGDRLETDILAGQRAGVITILMLTGVTSRQGLASSNIKPDYVFENLVELQTALSGNIV